MPRRSAAPDGYIPSFEDKLAEFFLSLSDISSQGGKYLQGQEEAEDRQSNQWLQRLLTMSQLTEKQREYDTTQQNTVNRRAALGKAGRGAKPSELTPEEVGALPEALLKDFIFPKKEKPE